MRRLRVDRISEDTYELGEGPRWDGTRLVWVDILAGRLVLAAFAGGRARVTGELTIDRPLGAVAPRADGTGWVVAAGRGVGLLDADGTLRMLAEPEPETNRMNDGACDPAGRFFAGSMAYDETTGAGTLYRLHTDGTLATAWPGLTISNGLGWSPDERTMFLNDSAAGTIAAFDYDTATGELSNHRLIVDLSGGSLGPDGLAIDDAGCLWAAIWGGSAVRRYTPDGRLDAVVELPTPQPTSCCFVGSTLVITTASHGLPPGDDAGAVFAVDAGVAGPPVTPYSG